jgi:hypothetical protein
LLQLAVDRQLLQGLACLQRLMLWRWLTLLLLA